MVRGAPKEKAALNGRRKAAILMVAMGPELAAEIYKHLSDEEKEEWYEAQTDILMNHWRRI